MKHSGVIQSIVVSYKTHRPLWIWGAVGVGKSDSVRCAAEIIGLEHKDWQGVIDLRASLLSAVDVRGLPKIDDGVSTWCPPDFLPSKGSGILFLDELASAPPMVQSALLQLALDRQVGDYKLPEGWVVIAASNRAEDRAGVHRIITPLLRRFWHVDFDVDLGEWQRWAAENGIAPEIRAYLKTKPEALFQFDADKRATPNPRAWEFASDLFKTAPQEIIHEVLAGVVGDGAAGEFIGWIKVFKKIPTVEEILANPKKAKMPNEDDASSQYAVAAMLADAARRLDSKQISKILAYAVRLPEEYSVFLGCDLSVICPQALLEADGEGAEWIEKHYNVITENLTKVGGAR